MSRPVRAPRLAPPTALALALLLVAAVSAEAVPRGSSLRQSANVPFGCEGALRPNPIFGYPEIVATGNRTCTLRGAGNIGGRISPSIVPGRGRITRFSVRVGRNPAPLRLTIATGSTTPPDPTAGTSGDFRCCTTRFFGPAFRPRANAVTTRLVNIPVDNQQRGGGASFFDVVTISAMGPGSLPLHTTGNHFTFAFGSPLTYFYYPYMRLREPRPEANGADGFEVLLRWEWVRRR